MGLGIRRRLFVWLGLVVVPVLAAAWLVVNVVDTRLSQRIEADLANTRSLEAARIDDALEDYERDARSLAAGGSVRTLVGAVGQYRVGRLPAGQPIEGVDGFAAVDPEADLPLQELTESLQKTATHTGSEVLELQIVGRDGQVYGATSGFGWEPYDPSIVDRAMTSEGPIFGNAFRAAPGDDRLGLVAPVTGLEGDVVGALVLETRLGPIVDLVVAHEGLGETSEAHIAQPTADGDAEFITLLRFQRDAAFSIIVPAESGLPINQSLESPDGLVLRSSDYRGVESVLAVETIRPTNWGLVVKMDASEAFAPVREVQRVVGIAAVLALVITITGWVLLVHPLGRRLRRAALAADRIAGGEYNVPLGDTHRDEIGDMSRSIDQLAADLDEDIKIRAVAETSLRHRADHDDLTNLCNRQYATMVLRETMEDDHGSEVSILYLDVDGFKDINDTYGHGVGDEVLVAVAKRLSRTAKENTTVARWGGDEFVVILPGIGEFGALSVADRIRNLFADPIVTSAGRHFLRCSVGASTSGGGRSIDEVIHDADSAMFNEKQRRAGLRAVSSTSLRVVEEALEDNRIEVWYQPMMVDAWGAVPQLAGAEALVRLRTSDGGLLPPFDFVPDVQHRQLGLALDRRVMAIAMNDTARWHREGAIADSFRLAINVGSASVQDEDLPASIVTHATDVGLLLSTIVVEISEDAAELNSAVIEGLRATGVAIAVDDVGLHYSNLDRLVEVRPDVAKIDRRWLGDPMSQPSGHESVVLSRLVEVCHGLGMTVVAEGVETADQLAMVRELGVSRYQGFYFDPPICAADFESKWCRETSPV